MSVKRQVFVSADTVAELIEGLMQCPEDAKFEDVDYQYYVNGGKEYFKLFITIDAS